MVKAHWEEKMAQKRAERLARKWSVEDKIALEYMKQKQHEAEMALIIRAAFKRQGFKCRGLLT